MKEQAFLLAAEARPTPRQLRWQQTEFYGLISYGMPVFTGKQYGDGFTPPSVFCPEEMDTDVWCALAKSAGMKGLVLTCKHYDGFCLWPTRQTDYSVKSANWLGGEGDLVRMTADSCRRAGLKFGVFITPWDRHEPTYGTGKAYDDFFCGLLRELLTDYGEIFCVWLDGVCGAGEKRVQEHDWGRYYSLIRSLQPDAAISFMGPDVRWCGNDRGMARAAEWSSVPAGYGVREDGSSPKLDPKTKGTLISPDLGSRKAIRHERAFIWYPCEVSVPLRQHWFFDPAEEYSAKTKDKLLKLYYETVGNNANLMLGLSPNKRGAFTETETSILTAFGRDLRLFFGGNILDSSGVIEAPGGEGDPENLRKEDRSFWRYGGKAPAVVTVRLPEREPFDKLVLQEHIENGQHIEAFTVEALSEKNRWIRVYSGETVGYKKICPLNAMQTQALRITFTSYRSFIELSHIRIN